jgi:preprotein translocase subunit SecD
VLTTDAAVKSQVVSCSKEGGTSTKFLLDAAKVQGEDISSASFSYDLANYQGWYVQLAFKGAGQAAWANLTSQLYQQYQSDGTYRQVAIVLDNETVTAPQIESAINGPAIISGGGMTKNSSQLLQTQLKFGALPVSFTPQDIVNTSASLGLAQLKGGLLAGGIGLALVVLYCLFYYRALGLVVIASLGISASLIYAAIVLLGRSSLGFTLSLAGVAGFIVAIGITADSFVVFFERVKDEVRDGKTARSAVPRAWSRARRTILSADAVSLIAAVVLVWLATGPVSSFAFTLGLSTLIDLVVVFLFTHPLVAVLSGSKTFTSPRISGLGELRRARTTDSAAPARLGSIRTKES